MTDLILSLIPGQCIAWAAVAVAALSAMWFGGRKSAKNDAKLEAANDKAEAYEVRNEIDNRIAADRNARERLSNDWSR